MKVKYWRTKLTRSCGLVLIWIQGEYKGQETTVFQQFRRGRSADDVKQSSLRVVHSVQNRLTSFCSAVVCKLKSRLSTEKNHRCAELILTSTKLWRKGKMILSSMMLGGQFESFDEESKLS